MKPYENSVYIGPHLNEGPLPTLFYFALSAEESLTIDPYNQSVCLLANYPLRIFSIDLPAHGPNLPAIEAMGVWAQEISSGNDIIGCFIKKAAALYYSLESKGLIAKGKFGVAGLSRGAFIATHVAAKISAVTTILGFAPLTQLPYVKEFKELPQNPLAESLSLHHLIPSLIGKNLRFYIGNHDTRVGTHRCFHFIEELSKASFHHKIRSPQVELFIKPSIGQYGHGTSTETFQEGAIWIGKQLGVIVP